MDVKNCVALVTGANRGIGAAFVTALLEAGAARVYAGCRDPHADDHEFDREDPRIQPIALDVTNPESIATAARECADAQLLVNNAGYFANLTLLNAPDVSAARQEMEVNYFGPLQMSRAFAPNFAANGGGAIVNVLSAGAIVAVPNMGGYSPSKFAARAMGTALRAELAEQQIQVHSLIVGSVDTRMAEHVQGKKESPMTVAVAGIKAVRNNIPEVDTDAFAVNVRDAKARDPARLEQQMAAALHVKTPHTGR